jgi:hypothetical protein
MPDALGGAGIGAGGGALAAAVVYALDRAFGSGRGQKRIEEKFDELKGSITTLTSIAESAKKIADKLYDWHNVGDPDDPSGKLWYFSVALRRLLESLQTKVSKLLELLDQLVRRFDEYNVTMGRLISVVEALQKDVLALRVEVSGLKQGQGRK